MIYETANAYYFRSILKIGGIESHLYYMAKKYGMYEITVFYREGDTAQINRLREYVSCVKLVDGDRIKCTNLFCCFNKEVLDFCEAERKYLVLHGDYLDMVQRGQLSKSFIPKDDRIDTYLGVSHRVCESWEKLTGIPAEFVGEPVLPDTERPLLFLSATRLSAEKGWGRMKVLAESMLANGINFIWFVLTDSPRENPPKGMMFLPTRLDIASFMSLFDAYIQLSDSEGFCLSAVESLLANTPVIGTDLPVFHEIGLNKKNSILIKHDMSDIPYDDIRNIRKKKFKYVQPEDRWENYLDHKPSRYKVYKYRVRATDQWQIRGINDIECGRVRSEGEEFVVSESRYDDILRFENIYHTKMIELVETIEK